MTRGLPSQPVPNRRLVTAEGGSSSLLYNLRGAQSPDAYLSNDDWLALPIPTAGPHMVHARLTIRKEGSKVRGSAALPTTLSHIYCRFW